MPALRPRKTTKRKNGWPASMATARQQTKEQLREQAQLALLRAEAIEAMQRPAAMPVLLQSVAALLVGRLEAAFARVWTLGPTGQTLELQASAGLYTHLNGPHGRVPVGQFKIGRIAQTRRPHVTNQVIGDPQVPEQEWARREGLVAFAGFPLVLEDRLLGVVALFARHELSALAIETFGVVASTLAQALGRKQAEEALRRAEKQWELTFESVPDLVAVIDDQCRIKRVNRAMAERLGRAPEQCAGLLCYECLHGLSQPPEFCPHTRTIADRGVHSCEIHEPRLGGHFLVSTTPLFDETRRLVGTVHVSRDITQRKRVEEALRGSEARLAQAVRLAGLGIFEHDHKSDLIEYSPVLRELLNFPENVPVTIPATLERVVAEDRAALAAAIQRAHDPRGDGLFEVEYRVARPDGQIRWLSARSQTFFAGQGSERRPARTIGAVLDVTERKEFAAGLERLVAERTAKLREMVGELEHFSYSITHDMRAPLRAMQGFAHMVLTEEGVDCLGSASKDYLRRIAEAAERMDLQITDALRFSEAIRTELVLKPVDVEPLLRSILESYPNLQPPGVEIRLEGDFPLVLGNEAALTQCFSNLLDNAVTFVAPGTVPQVRVWAETREGQVRLWFEDNGNGIYPQEQARIFDMFYQGAKTHEGTGIGLALVRKNMERMGGTVGVVSEPGQGSRFWLELKLA